MLRWVSVVWERWIALLRPCCWQRGHQVDPRNYEIVTKWCRCLEIGQLRSFLGLCNHFCGFIHEYYNLMALLTALTWNKTMFIWRDDCECAFETIKFALTHVSILTLPKLGEPFEVNNDASLMVNLVSRRKTYCLWKYKTFPCWEELYY